MSTEPTPAEIALAPLIEQAEREGKLLESTYQNILFTPTELRRANAEGRFRWDLVNWRLRDIADVLKGYEASVENAKQELEKARRRFTP